MLENPRPPNVGGQSAWSPFLQPDFRLLWSGTLISNLGVWMTHVGAGWLMTEISVSPGMVALVSATATAPAFMFVLLAGALADRMDKRRYLLIVNLILFVVLALLTGLTLAGAMTPGLLLAFTFVLGTGAAFNAPAWQSVVPTLVPPDQLAPAVALNSLGMNASRAVGPAIAGLLIAFFGIWAPFLAHTLAVVYLIGLLFIWRPASQPVGAIPEPIPAAILTGFNHVAGNPAFQHTIIRGFAFFGCASAFWALLPLVVRRIPAGGPELYGLLLAAVGAGAVIGALLMPSLHVRFGINRLVAAGSIAAAIALCVLGLVPMRGPAIMASMLGGLGWIVVMTSLNVSAQMALPDWVRARGMSIALMGFFGSMAAGSTIWGQVAGLSSVSLALLMAAAGMLALIPLTWDARLRSHPKGGSAEGGQAVPLEMDRGPVLVTISYQIDHPETAAFLSAMSDLSLERRLDGALDWGIYQEATNPRYWVEWYFLPLWADHLHHQERVSPRDLPHLARVLAYHRGEGPPQIRAYLAPTHFRPPEPPAAAAPA